MKEGDVVTISPNLEDLEKAKKHYPFGINTGMLSLRGRQAQITMVRTDSYHPSHYPDYPNLDGNRYSIDLDNGIWAWANIMFKPCIGNLKIVEEKL